MPETWLETWFRACLVGANLLNMFSSICEIYECAIEIVCVWNFNINCCKSSLRNWDYFWSKFGNSNSDFKFKFRQMHIKAIFLFHSIVCHLLMNYTEKVGGRKCIAMMGVNGKNVILFIKDHFNNLQISYL